MSRLKSGSFIEVANEIGELVAKKNKAYGDSHNKSSDFLEILFPDGVPVEKYNDMLTIVRMFDKQMRIATNKDVLGENPYKDIAGYAILKCAEPEDEDFHFKPEGSI